MTKEVDFLSLSKTDTNVSKGTKTSGTEKKEGLSLFDSLLANSKEQTETKDINLSNEKSTQNNDSQKQTSEKEITTKPDNKQVEIKKEDVDNTENKKTIDNKTSLNEEVKEENKNISKNPTEQVETKTTESSNNRNSMLDRMILEANQKVKSNNLNTQETQTQTESTKEELKEEITEENKSQNLNKPENKEENTKKINTSETNTKTETKILEKSESNTSLLDKLVASAKEELNSKVDSNIKEKEVDKISKKEENKPTNEIESKTEKTSSLIDKLVSEAKKDIESTNSNNKENKEIEDTQTKVTKSSTIVQTQGELNFDDIQEPKVENQSKTTSNATDEEIKTVNKQEIVLDKNQNNELEKNIALDSKKVEKDIGSTKKENPETLASKEVLTPKPINNEDLKVESETQINKTKLVNILDEESDSTRNKPVQNNNTNLDSSKNKLAGLDEKALNTENEKIDLNKDDISKLKETPVSDEETKEEPLKQNSRSLMDRLFDNAKTQTISSKVGNTQENITSEQTSSNKNNNDIATNIYLSSQKNSIYNQMLSNKSEGVKTVKDASSIEDVKKGAEILNLNLEDSSVEVEENLQKTEPQTSNNKSNLDSKISLLDKIAFNKNLNVEELLKKAAENIETQKVSSNSVTNSSFNSNTSTTTEVQTLNLNVNPNLALNIQNRIIGAQQQMSSMMSDVARNMYENYKPPVTAFRLNLFPAQLGHIAILMKTDRENAISISMNLSQSSTHDAFVENQSMLRDALNRNFNNTQTTFSLDFSMQNENSNNSSSDNQNSNNENNPQAHSSDEVIESIIQNKDTAEDLNYM